MKYQLTQTFLVFALFTVSCSTSSNDENARIAPGNGDLSPGLSVVSLAPVADALVRGGRYKNVNHGGQAHLTLKDDGDGNMTRFSYLKFAIPKSISRVLRAELHLTCGVHQDASNLDRLCIVHDDAWDEKEITMKNRPAFGEEIASWRHPKTGDRVIIDVTDSVKEEQQDDNVASFGLFRHGWAISAYASKEHTNVVLRPKLVLVVEGASSSER